MTILGDFGFQPISQRGSHVKVRRILEDGQTQTLTIPNHREVDRGTLHALFRQACRFIAEPELRRMFFTD
jgi:predicted RNA binding protein YcfA (HicA-like mRNA interferase family)